MLFFDSHGGAHITCTADHEGAQAFGPTGVSRPLMPDELALIIPGFTPDKPVYAQACAYGLVESDNMEDGWDLLLPSVRLSVREPAEYHTTPSAISADQIELGVHMHMSAGWGVVYASTDPRAHIACLSAMCQWRDALVVYVTYDDEDGDVYEKRIRIDKDGNMLDRWPGGFFPHVRNILERQ